MREETIVVALGGNAILQPGQRGTVQEQLDNVNVACEHLVKLIASGNYGIVITHGNGPQVGNVLLGDNGVYDSTNVSQSSKSCWSATQYYHYRNSGNSR